MEKEQFAIIDEAGTIYEGDEEFVMGFWEDEDKLWDDVKEDGKHKGDLRLVKILDMRH